MAVSIEAGSLRVRRLPVFGTIGATYREFFRHFKVYLIATLAASVPPVLGNLAVESLPLGAGTKVALALAVGFILGLLLQPLLAAVVGLLVNRFMQGGDIRFFGILTVGLGRLGPVFVTSILLLVAMYLGFSLLIIPGLLVIVMYWLAIPACVIEQKGPFESFTRSRKLTKGSRWRLFWILGILGLSMIAMIFLLSVPALMVVHMITESPSALLQLFLSFWINSTMFLTVPVAIIAQIACYRHLASAQV